MDTIKLAQKIKERAMELGFDGCGIVRLEDLRDYEDRLNERIEACPDTKELLENFRKFARPEQTYPWAKSVIVCLSRYDKYNIPDNLKGLIGKYYLCDHKPMPQSQVHKNIITFENYLDGLGIKCAKDQRGVTSARWSAYKAGLGYIRKNNFLYTKYGSWVIIDMWVIDKELEWKETNDLEPCPENCDLCIKACPTKALRGPHCTHMTSCINRLTWVSKDLLPNDLNEKMGGWLYGCDECQDACPKNKTAKFEDIEFPGLDKINEELSPVKILYMDEQAISELLWSKFNYIGQDYFWLWKVNALRAMTNAFKLEYRQHIIQALNDDHEKVREMALRSVKKLGLIADKI